MMFINPLVWTCKSNGLQVWKTGSAYDDTIWSHTVPGEGEDTGIADSGKGKCGSSGSPLPYPVRI